MTSDQTQAVIRAINEARVGAMVCVVKALPYDQPGGDFDREAMSVAISDRVTKPIVELLGTLGVLTPSPDALGWVCGGNEAAIHGGWPSLRR